jgi:hypothetical protein
MIESLEEAQAVLGQVQKDFNERWRGRPLPAELGLVGAQALGELRERGVDAVAVRVRDLGWGPEEWGHVLHLEVELDRRYGTSPAAT